jgi:N-acyl-D-amino-acid deacylase
MLDIKIKGGQILDGTGSPAVSTDVGIFGDRIREIGDLSMASAKTTIDATGKYVTPGFIDAHSHSDTYLLIQLSAQSKLYQGITTEIVGNCGASAAPLFGDAHMPSDWRDKTYPGDWRTVAEYRELIERLTPAVNVAMLIGHNTLRTGIAGYENRPLTQDEMAEMIRRLEQGLDEGARGLSSGLLYAPGMFAPPEELVELAKVAGKHGGIYTSHMRSESKGLLDAIQETIAVGRVAGIRIQISHLKTSGRRNWDLIEKAIALIISAKNEGVDIAADRYPYTSSCTDLDVIFPAWAEEGGSKTVLKRLRDPSDRARLRKDLLKSRTEDYWETIVIGSTNHPDNARFRGVKLTDVAKQLGMEPVDALLHLTETDELRTSAFFFGMSEENMMKILAEPYVMLGTDASLRAPTGPLSRDYPHPRAYGSFPRFLRMALDAKTVPLPDAVRKMTSLPASRFGLTDRGVLAAEKKADIVIFDPATVRDTATYSAPHQLAQGIDRVIVNGVVTLARGNLTGFRAGRFL